MKKISLNILLYTLVSVFCLSSCNNKTNQALFDDFEYFFEEEQFDDAIKTLDRILTKDSTSVFLYHARAICNQRTSNYNVAIADLTKALKFDKEDVLALTLRANTYTLVGEYKKAIEDYDKAVIFKGFNTTQNSAPANKYKMKNKEILRTPLFFDIIYLRGKAYYETFDLIRAIDDFNLCIESSSDSGSKFDKVPECYYWRGRTYARLGELNRACEDFHIAAESGINQAFVEIEENCKNNIE